MQCLDFPLTCYWVLGGSYVGSVGLFGSRPLGAGILLTATTVCTFILPIVRVFRTTCVVKRSTSVTEIILCRLVICANIPVAFVFGKFLLQGVTPN